MYIQEKASLQKLNTFGLPAQAKYLAAFQDEPQLRLLLEKFAELPKLILGGGSNILFTKDVDGVILKNEIKGIEMLREDTQHLWLKVGAGENWSDFVDYCVAQGYAGIENLSLIPGTVGAAPIQNIGAYGVEVQAVIHQVETLGISSKMRKVFQWEDCNFGYRNSIFKNELKNQHIITRVIFRLDKIAKYHVDYGAIREVLGKKGLEQLSIKAVSEAVIQIRQEKLPDPAKIGNGGSFFKNPELKKADFEALKAKNPQIPHYLLSGNKVKVPAAWLIDQAGWKGKRWGEVGVHPKQALVLVNYGKGSGQEILQLSQEIQNSVQQRFDVYLEPEINIL